MTAPESYVTIDCGDSKWWTDGAVMVRHRHQVPPLDPARHWRLKTAAVAPSYWLTKRGRPIQPSFVVHQRMRDLLLSAARIDAVVLPGAKRAAPAIRCWDAEGQVFALVMQGAERGGAFVTIESLGVRL